MTDAQYMKRCLDLAAKGKGSVEPNPMVGCVIVHGNRIIGEGFHVYYGGPHAEVNAFAAVALEDAALFRESVLYVSLEPCNHHGKTPPCTDKILASGIRKVVIGTLDPNPMVAGKGAQRLKDAGVSVEIGIEAEACLALNKAFFTFHKLHRPFITLKWAMSKDGYISQADGSPVHFSNAEADKMVHQLRADHMAILVGAKTVITDNPKLTTRLVEGRNPIRMVVDTHGFMAGGFDVFNKEAETILFTTNPDLSVPNAQVVPFEEQGNYIQQIMGGCFHQEIQSVLVEGGAKTLQAFIDGGWWDEMIVIVSSIELGAGIKGPDVTHMEMASTELGDNRIFRSTNTQPQGIA